MKTTKMTQRAIIAICILALMAGGCTTSGYSRKRAAKAVVLLDAYEKQQKDRIQKLNEEYVKVEGRLRQAHIDELQRWVSSSRDEDSRALADAILMDWEYRTLPSAIAQQFSQSKEREIARVNKQREDVAIAQKVYQAAYQELSLPLKKVQAAKAAMQVLAEKDADGPSREKFLEVLNNVRNYIDEAQKKAEEKKKASAATTKSPA